MKNYTQAEQDVAIADLTKYAAEVGAEDWLDAVSDIYDGYSNDTLSDLTEVAKLTLDGLSKKNLSKLYSEASFGLPEDTQAHLNVYSYCSFCSARQAVREYMREFYEGESYYYNYAPSSWGDTHLIVNKLGDIYMTAGVPEYFTRYDKPTVRRRKMKEDMSKYPVGLCFHINGKDAQVEKHGSKRIHYKTEDQMSWTATVSYLDKNVAKTYATTTRVIG